ncbi:thiamine diphosphokinase [Oceanivirga salmonicida]|uniref:thiamine diphosphokinase n=1 Tax=Oceanivirga salmonicida TaxID=1769291 RepID=UPI000835AEA6|nr:thiamine diphosphokinase [Oceanivirga salmonicida]
MEKIIIFLNGVYSDNLEKIKSLCTNRKIIAVDGGTNMVYKLDLIPDKIVGDMDSINNETLKFYKNKDIEIIKLDKEKDHTDFEVALLDYVPNKTGRFKNQNIEKENFDNLINTDILVLGATGNRLDMTMSNLKKLHSLPNMYFISENFETIKYINKSTDFKNLKGKTFSIIPITDIEEITLIGFKYPLNKNNISKDFGLVSNIVENNLCTVKFKKGEMYIIYM